MREGDLSARFWWFQSSVTYGKKRIVLSIFSLHIRPMTSFLVCYSRCASNTFQYVSFNRGNEGKVKFRRWKQSTLLIGVRLKEAHDVKNFFPSFFHDELLILKWTRLQVSIFRVRVSRRHFRKSDTFYQYSSKRRQFESWNRIRCVARSLRQK